MPCGSSNDVCLARKTGTDSSDHAPQEWQHPCPRQVALERAHAAGGDPRGDRESLPLQADAARAQRAAFAEEAQTGTDAQDSAADAEKKAEEVAESAIALIVTISGSRDRKHANLIWLFKCYQFGC